MFNLELKDTLDKLELQERNLSEKLKYDSQMERDFMVIAFFKFK